MIRVCPKCGRTWLYTQGHFFCKPKPMTDVLDPLFSVLYAQGYNNTTIGKAIGVDRRTVGKWRSGQENPSQAHLNVLKSFVDRIEGEDARTI